LGPSAGEDAGVTRRPLVAALSLYLASVAWAGAAAGAEGGPRVDVRADERYAACVRMLEVGEEAAGRGCLEAVVEMAPESTAAVRARAVLTTRPRAAALGEMTGPPTARPFLPGHLELVLAAGSFGIWNGAAGAIVLGTDGPIIPPVVSLAGGAAAVGLGAAYGLGAWALARGLELEAGDARLIASGIGWGTGFGFAMAPWAFSLAGAPWPDGALPPLDDDFERALPVALVPPVLGGYVGLLGAGALALMTDLEPSQVSTLNTGGWVGLALGLCTTPFLSMLGVGAPTWVGLWYLGTSAAGLASGFGVAHLLELDLWETWLIDAGALAGLAVFGGGALLLRAGAPADIGADVVAGGVAATGTLVGLVGSAAAVTFFRVRRGDSASRVGWLPFDLLYAPPQAVLDKSGRLVPVFPVLAGRF
jgi:hypothetical protein